MGKRWGVLCLAGCLVLGLASIGSSSAYAGEGKKLAMEGAVFDLNSSSSLSVYGYVTDKTFHAVGGAEVSAKPSRGTTLKGTSLSDGGYRIVGIEDNTTYTLTATKKGLPKTKAIKLKVNKDEKENFIVNFQFKGIDKGGSASKERDTGTEGQ